MTSTSAPLNLSLNIRVLDLDPKVFTPGLSHDPYLHVALSKRANPNSEIAEVREPYGECLVKGQWPAESPETQQLLQWESINICLFASRKIVDENEPSRLVGHSRREPLAESVVFLRDLLPAQKKLYVALIDASDAMLLHQEEQWLNVTPLKTFRSFNDLKNYFDANRFLGLRAALEIELLPADDGSKYPDITTSSSETKLNYRRMLYQAVTGVILDQNVSLQALRQKLYAKEAEQIYIKAVRDLLAPTEMSCMSVHVPLWTVVMGPLLGPIYAIYNSTQPIDQLYVLHCLAIVCSQHNTTVSNLRRVLLDQRNEPSKFGTETVAALSIIGQAITLFSNTCDYMPDQSRGEPTERFLEVFKTLGGDCEDVAQEIRSFVFQLQRANQVESNSILDLLRWILRKYQAFLTTGAVTDASATAIRNESGTTTGGGTSAASGYICHTYVMLVPNHYVSNVMLRWSDKDVIGIKRVAAAQDLREKLTYNDFVKVLERESGISFADRAKLQALRPPVVDEQLESKLPVLTLEGTNFVAPQLDHPANYVTNSPPSSEDVEHDFAAWNQQRDALHQRFPHLNALGSLAVQQGRRRADVGRRSGFINFYRKVNEFWMADEINNLPPTPLEVMYNDGHYGVWIEDIVRKDPRVRLLPVYTFSQTELALSNEALTHLQPMVVTRFTGTSHIQELRENIIKPSAAALFAHLDELAQHYPLSKEATKPSETLSLIPKYLIYYANHAARLVNDSELIKIIDEVAKMRGFAYFIHPLSGDGALYLIELRFSYK